MLVIAGVDTHHLAALKIDTDARLWGPTGSRDPAWYVRLFKFVAALGVITPIGIEGTNSYDTGLALFLAAAGVPIREVIRPKRNATAVGNPT